MNTFVTTPIYYASGEPHLGHVYSTVIADVVKRYRTLKGQRSYLVTGTDENGLKIENKAAEKGLLVQDFVAEKSQSFQNLWQALDILPDSFIRTSDEVHQVNVSDTWRKLADKGDIYLGEYKGQYCIECEQFYRQWQLKDDSCPIHATRLEEVSEPSYFFRVDRYRERLLSYYRENPEFIYPAKFKNEVITYLEQEGSIDLSISRLRLKNGIPVPGDEAHTVYVWFDALLSYITAIKQHRHAEVDIGLATHIIGKDILIFHAVYWPAILLALNLPLPKRVVVHGWWNIDGRKLSKSDRGAVVNPKSLSDYVSSDGLRYALLAQKPLENDSPINLNTLIGSVNSGLAKGVGNLVKRFVSVVNQTFDGVVEDLPHHAYNDQSLHLLNFANKSIREAELCYERFAFNKVCAVVADLVRHTNQYIQHSAPWLLEKSKSKTEVLECLLVVRALIKVIATLLQPITPNLYVTIAEQVGVDSKRLYWPAYTAVGGFQVAEAESLFEKV